MSFKIDDFCFAFLIKKKIIFSRIPRINNWQQVCLRVFDAERLLKLKLFQGQQESGGQDVALYSRQSSIFFCIELREEFVAFVSKNAIF